MRVSGAFVLIMLHGLALSFCASRRQHLFDPATEEQSFRSRTVVDRESSVRDTELAWSVQANEPNRDSAKRADLRHSAQCGCYRRCNFDFRDANVSTAVAWDRTYGVLALPTLLAHSCGDAPQKLSSTLLRTLLSEALTLLLNRDLL